MNYPVDVEIYLAKFKDQIISANKDNGFFKDTAAQFSLDLSFEEEFNESLMYEITMYALDNFEKHEDPTLTQSQFIDCIKSSVAHCSLQSLKNKGLVECVCIKYFLPERLMSSAIISFMGTKSPVSCSGRS